VAVQLASSQITGLGSCPDLQGVSNFDVNQYLGQWFEVKKYPNFFSRDSKCINANYGLRDDGNISISNQQKRPDGTDEPGVNGVARVVSSGVLGVSFPRPGCKFNFQLLQFLRF
jgi:apolipoprotein D and lipocalin family protein